MSLKRMSSLMGWGAAAIAAALLTACGGGGGGGGGGAAAPAVGGAVGAAAVVAGNDAAVNPAAAFAVVQAAGQAVVNVASPPTINFTVFSDGAVKTGLTTANVRFAIAKLVPGTGGNPDQWVNYIYKRESVTGANNVGSGAGGTPAVAGGAMQATTDPTGTLAYDATTGVYTYTFTVDIRDPAYNVNSYTTNGVTFDPTKVHRIAMQLSYNNAAGTAVKVNPYYDFKFEAYTTGCTNQP